MAVKIHLDEAALQRILRGAGTQRVVQAAAEKVAAHVRDDGVRVGSENGGRDEIPLPVEVTTTDRDARVVLAHPAGIAVQAKHGSLTKAAAQAGLQVMGGRP